MSLFLRPKSLWVREKDGEGNVWGTGTRHGVELFEDQRRDLTFTIVRGHSQDHSYLPIVDVSSIQSIHTFFLVQEGREAHGLLFPCTLSVGAFSFPTHGPLVGGERFRRHTYLSRDPVVRVRVREFQLKGVRFKRDT